MHIEKLKKCADCAVSKPYADFYTRGYKGTGVRGSDGKRLMSYCKPCTLVRNAVRWQTNREKYKVKSKERYLANRAERLEHNKQRRKKLLEGGDQVLYAHIWNGEVMYVGMGDILRPYAFRERAADHKAMIKSSGEPKVVIVASSKDRGMIVTLEAFILWRLHQAGRLPKFNKSL